MGSKGENLLQLSTSHEYPLRNQVQTTNKERTSLTWRITPHSPTRAQRQTTHVTSIVPKKEGVEEGYDIITPNSRKEVEGTQNHKMSQRQQFVGLKLSPKCGLSSQSTKPQQPILTKTCIDEKKMTTVTLPPQLQISKYFQECFQGFANGFTHTKAPRTLHANSKFEKPDSSIVFTLATTFIPKSITYKIK